MTLTLTWTFEGVQSSGETEETLARNTGTHQVRRTAKTVPAYSIGTHTHPNQYVPVVSHVPELRLCLTPARTYESAARAVRAVRRAVRGRRPPFRPGMESHIDV